MLRSYPIRKNDTIKEYKGELYRLVSSTEDFTSSSNKIILFNDKVVAEKAENWSVFELDQVDHQIKEVKSGEKSITLNLKSNTTKELTLTSTEPYKCFIQDTDIRS